jgi:hypothetical protein
MSIMGYWNTMIRNSGWPWLTPQAPTKTDISTGNEGYRDPTCPKCGIVLGNRMNYCCPHFHCPVGLN